MKHWVLFIINFLYIFNTEAFFLTSKQNDHINALIFSHDPMLLETDSSYAQQYFFNAAFKFPLLLQYAEKHTLPVIFLCPTQFDNVGPLDKNAYTTEGARVALAWASAYIRFRNSDIRIILMPTEKKSLIQLPHLVNPSLNKIIHQTNVPEINVENRMFFLNDLVYENENSYNFQNIIERFSLESDNSKVLKVIPKNKQSENLKRVAITGGAGFIGSHLVKKLLDLNYYVIALDSFLCCNKENIKPLLKYKNFEFHEIDVTQPYDIEGNLDAIIHLASVPSPQYYYKLPFETLATGLHGTKNALDLALRKNARFVFASSSEVYGDPEISPQTEDYPGNANPWGMRSQYDQSKRGGETLCKWYFDNYGLDIRIARIFNTYGPGMNLHDGRVVTNFIAAALDRKPMVIYGSGNQTRSFSFITNTIEQLLILLENNEIAKAQLIQERVFNIGNDEEFTINEVAIKLNKIIEKYLGYLVSINHIEQIDPTDPKKRKPCLNRIKKLGFNSTITLSQGLEEMFIFFGK
ncbi:MAG: NAD-dependent epimerase/dehydratase family protein [Candidatus Babeliales bacterium]